MAKAGRFIFHCVSSVAHTGPVSSHNNFISWLRILAGCLNNLSWITQLIGTKIRIQNLYYIMWSFFLHYKFRSRTPAGYPPTELYMTLVPGVRADAKVKSSAPQDCAAHPTLNVSH